MPVEIGMRGEDAAVVAQEDTAQAVGSGLVPVFATPRMIALEPGQGTVGTRLDVKHSAATPVGMKVRAQAEVIGVEGRQVVFLVTAFDEAEQIGGGTHERFIIQTDKFLARAQGKLNG